MNIFESLRNIFAVPDLRKRLFFSFALLGVYRIGSHLPTPGLDAAALEEFFRSQAGGLLGFLDIFSGGALRRLSVFALGITPYITASIILQLLTVVWPYLEKLSKEGEMGRRKITQYTRYGTVILSVVQGAGIALWLWSQTTPTGRHLALRDPSSEVGKLPFVLMAVLTLTTGTAFVMWLGEQITERGIGNGISLIIYAGIVASLPSATIGFFQQVQRGADEPLRGPLPPRLHDRGRGRHRLRRARAAADPGPVREAGRRTARLRRAEHLPSAPREHGRRHPDHLRGLDHPVPAVHRVGLQEPT